MFGRAGVVAAAVAGRLRADAVPRQVGHQGRLLEEGRHFTDVLHCRETETPADESEELALGQVFTGRLNNRMDTFKQG